MLNFELTYLIKKVMYLVNTQPTDTVSPVQPMTATGDSAMRPDTQLPLFPKTGAAPGRDSLLREAMAGQWPGMSWLETILDRVEARR